MGEMQPPVPIKQKSKFKPSNISSLQMRKLKLDIRTRSEPNYLINNSKTIGGVAAYLKNIYPGMLLRAGLKYFLKEKDNQEAWKDPYLLRETLLKDKEIQGLFKEGEEKVSVALNSQIPVVYTSVIKTDEIEPKDEKGKVLQLQTVNVFDKSNSIKVLYRAMAFMDLLQFALNESRGSDLSNADKQKLISLALECTDARTPLDGLNDMSDVSNQTEEENLNKSIQKFIGVDPLHSQAKTSGSADHRHHRTSDSMGSNLGHRSGHSMGPAPHRLSSEPDLNKMTREELIALVEELDTNSNLPDLNEKARQKTQAELNGENSTVLNKAPPTGYFLGHGAPRSRAPRGPSFGWARARRSRSRSPFPCRSARTGDSYWCECPPSRPARAAGPPAQQYQAGGAATPYDSLFELSSSSSSSDDEEEEWDQEGEGSSDEEEQERELPNAYCNCDPCAVVKHGTYFGVGQYPALALAVEVVPAADSPDPACLDQDLRLVRCSRPEAFGSLPTLEKMVEDGCHGQDQTPAVRAFEARVRRALRKQGVAGILGEGCRVAVKGGARQWQVDSFSKVVREFLTPSAEHAAACEHVRAVKIYDPKRKQKVVVLLDPRRSKKKLQGALSVHEDLDAALAHLGQQARTTPGAVMLVADRHHRELSPAAAEKSRARLAVLEAAHDGDGALSAEDCRQHFGDDPVAAENCRRLYTAGKNRSKKKKRGSHYLVALVNSPSNKHIDWPAMGLYAMDQQLECF